MAEPVWVKLTIETTPEGVEVMANLLIEHGAGGVVVERRAVAAYFPGDRCLDDIKTAVLRLPSYVDLGSRKVTVAAVEDDDWTAAWRRHFRPFRVGRRLVVVPAWEDFSGPPGDLLIRIDPGQAFGSGEHPTTAMALSFLERVVTPSATVIDVGTGSGILAIAAARLGSARVWAVDIDPTAVAAAVANVRLNGLEDVVTVVEGSLGAVAAVTTDVIVANIVANVLMDLVAPAAARLAPDGFFIAGGIITPRRADVVGALAAAGMVIIDWEEQGDWVCLLAGLAGSGLGREVIPPIATRQPTVPEVSTCTASSSRPRTSAPGQST
jgi:ribosomal protein L11 methyltransferase